MPILKKSLVVPIGLTVLVSACSSGNGSGSGGPTAQSMPSSSGGSEVGDDGSTASGVDGSSGSSGAGGSEGGSLQMGATSSSGGAVGNGSSASSGAGSSGAQEAGVDGAAPGGTAAVAAFCAAGCERARDCAVQLDAGTIDVASCLSTCEAENATVTAYREDYWAADTACMASASCADTLDGKSSASCGAMALAGLTPDAAVTEFCAEIEDLAADGGCLSPNACLDTYKVVSDPAVAALEACVTSPTFCTNPDAGTACFDQALLAY